MTINPKTAINISALPKSACFGCRACVSICPLNCIQMVSDQEGFFYPSVDEATCNACQKCVRTCPGFNDISRDSYLPEPAFFGGYFNKQDIRINSSSGGFFTAFAEEVLSKGGTVYGAIYDFDRMAVIHARASSPEALGAMRKSKYVQSDTGGVFEKIEQDLDEGPPVLFTGTPCQVAGLHLYLGKRPSNLFSIDLICHGVPSPGLFKRHFTKRQAQLGTPITNIDFRTKDKGWGGALNFYLKIESNDQKILTFAPMDAYHAMFLANLSLRPVCHRCKFASTKRVADITIGDYWGVDKKHPELYDGKGTSLVLANTEKEQRMLQAIQGKAKLQVLDSPEPLPPNLVRPTPKPRQRETFLRSIHDDSWQKQAAIKHVLAIALLVKNKFVEGIKSAFRLL